MNRHMPMLGALAVLTTPLTAQNATVLHYWSYEAPDEFLDKVGTADSSITDASTVTTTTGIRGAGAMKVPDIVAGEDDWHDIDGTTLFQPGVKPFSFSYWFRIPDDGVNVPRGIFDFSGNGQDGPQSLFIDNSTNPNGEPSMAFRIDHDNGGTTLAFVGLQEGPDWHFVAATFDPVAGLEVHLDGHGVDASAAAPFSPDSVSMDPGSFIGSFNYTGASDDKGLNGDIDDFAIYQGVLSEAEITGLFDGTVTPTDIDAPLPGPVAVGHYWDMDTIDDNSLIPVDLGNGLVTTGLGYIDTDIDYGEAYPDSGWSLNIDFEGTDNLVAETYDGEATGLDFGTGSFAISYLAFDHSDEGLGDGDPRGVMAMDCLSGTETGFQISTDPEGVFIFRLDDDDGNFITSISQVGTAFETLKMPANQWVCVVINVDRAADEVEIFFDAVSQGTYDISSLSGNVACSQDLQIGTINGGGAASQAQKAGLDDVAIYPGTLSAEQVTALCNHTVSPLDILATFETETGLGIPIVSVDYDLGISALTVVFTSEDGATYSVYGGPSLEDSATWPELSTTDLVGNGSDLTFTHAPAGSPPAFFVEVRED